MSVKTGTGKEYYNEFADILAMAVMIGAAALFGAAWRSEVKDEKTRASVIGKLSAMFDDDEKYAQLRDAVGKTYSPQMSKTVNEKLDAARAKYKELTSGGEKPDVRELEAILTNTSGRGGQAIARAAQMAGGRTEEEVKTVRETAAGLKIESLKYTEDQIDRLFTTHQGSVLARAAHIAAQHKAIAKAKHDKKFYKEDGEGLELPEGGGDDNLDDVIEKAAGLMDKLIGPCDKIIQELEQVDAETIDVLLDHLEDMAQTEDDRAFAVMAAAIKGVTGR